MKRPWMPLYIADYLADTAHLTVAEHGAYLLLIMHLWANGTLPSSDSEKLRRISKMSPKQWSASKETIQALFFDGWRHKRVEREWENAERFSAAGRKAGKKSAELRKAKAANGSATIEQRSLNGHGNDPQTTDQRSFNDQSTSTVTVTDTKSKKEASALRIRIVKIYESLGLEPIPDTALADAWVSQGYNPEICAAVIADNLGRTKKIKPLIYFENAIRERHERAPPRQAIAEETVSAAPPDEKTQHLLAKIWETKLANGEDNWTIETTPPPGKPGCKISAEILRQHGIDPDSGKRLQTQTS